MKLKIEKLQQEIQEFPFEYEEKKKKKSKLLGIIKKLKMEIKENQEHLTSTKRENSILTKNSTNSHYHDEFSLIRNFSDYLKERLDNNQFSKQYHRNFFLDFHQKFERTTIFFNLPRKPRIYYAHSKIKKEIPTEIICVDLKRDKRLNNEVNRILKKMQTLKHQEKDEKKIVQMLIREVSSFFNSRRITKEVNKKSKDNIVLIGEIQNGGSISHRSILFKCICDLFGIDCRLIKGYYTKTGHEWNIILLEKKMVMVDLMNSFDLIEITFENYMALNQKEQKTSDDFVTIQPTIKPPYSEIPDQKWQRIGNNGAQGQVFLTAMKNNLTGKNETVAIKRVEINPFSKQNQYLQKEVDLMKFFKHPKIMGLKYDFIKEIGDSFVVMYHCLVMELMDDDAKGFFQKIQSKKNTKRIKPKEKAKICLILFLEVLKGIDSLHNDLKIIHRDIKPENILVKYNKDTFELEKVKIADFGLVKQEVRKNERFSIVGTRGYVANEIIEGKKYDKSVDIYSLGKMLEECSSMYADICPNLVSFQKRCLDRDPSKRPSLESLMFAIIGELKFILPRTKRPVLPLRVENFVSKVEKEEEEKDKRSINKKQQIITTKKEKQKKEEEYLKFVKKKFGTFSSANIQVDYLLKKKMQNEKQLFQSNQFINQRKNEIKILTSQNESIKKEIDFITRSNLFLNLENQKIIKICDYFDERSKLIDENKNFNQKKITANEIDFIERFKQLSKESF